MRALGQGERGGMVLLLAVCGIMLQTVLRTVISTCCNTFTVVKERLSAVHVKSQHASAHAVNMFNTGCNA